MILVIILHAPRQCSSGIFTKFVLMQKIILFLFHLIFTCTIISTAQPAAPVYFKGAIKEKKNYPSTKYCSKYHYKKSIVSVK